MLINEVCKLTGLTKKAVAYYEAQGLLNPPTAENGYREYGDIELAALREISLLRALGMSVTDIRDVLPLNDRSAALKLHRSRLTGKLNRVKQQRECLDHIINSGCNTEGALEYTTRQLDENRVIRERLKEAFPGSYGRFISYHFGRFLNEKIDSPEKEAAYGRIIEFLDGLEDIPFPKEVEDMILQTTGTWNDEVVSSIERESNAATDDYPGFMEQKREIIEKYLEYIKSEAYQQSPGYKMKQLILEFQRASGYTEVFIENMKLLSRDYAQHLEKLRQANELFLSEYPEAAGLLGRE